MKNDLLLVCVDRAGVEYILPAHRDMSTVVACLPGFDEMGNPVLEMGGVVPVTIREANGKLIPFSSSLGGDAPLYGYDYTFTVRRFAIGHEIVGPDRFGAYAVDAEEREAVFALEVGGSAVVDGVEVRRIDDAPFDWLASRWLPSDHVVSILHKQDERVRPEQIHYYPDIDSMAVRAAGSKHWARGETFVYAEPDRFVLMCQIAPDSCEMMVLSQKGFHDVMTAYRMSPHELAARLSGHAEINPDGEPPGSGQYMTVYFDYDFESGFIVRKLDAVDAENVPEGYVVEEWRNGDIVDNACFKEPGAWRCANEWIRSQVGDHMTWRREDKESDRVAEKAG